MNLSNLEKIKTKSAKRIGRGSGSGTGTTAGRGTKGQKSRTGAKIPARFQGGSLPLWQRLPKKDGIKPQSLKPLIINLKTIEKHYSDGEVVSLKTLEEKNLIKVSDYDKRGLKILATGDLSKKITIDKTINTSKKVQEKIK